jgi:RHS repeat-associated protein
MSGISDKALKNSYAQNKFRHNGKELQNQEFSDGSGLEEYDYGSRLYDQQIGRWNVPDISADRALGWSPYRYGFDNPIRYLDPNGNYETDGHFWTVYLMATMMGSKYAYNIAYWTESPDHLMYPSGDPIKTTSTWLNPLNQGPMHALTGGYSAVERASSALAVGESTSTEELGLALHRLGDSYAHSTIADETRMYGAPLGHVYDMMFVIDPDKIANRPELYKQYVSQLSQALGHRLNFKGNIDLFTFDYIANNKGSTEQNSAIFETEVRIREGIRTFSVAGNQVNAINQYIGASNDHFGRDIQANVIYTTVDVYNKNDEGKWVKTKTEQRTFINIQ